MKVTTLLLVIVLVQASAKSFSQKITLRETNAPLEKVIKSIKRQSGYAFLYTDKDLQNEKITVQISNASIEDALKASFANTNVDYKIVGNNILLKKGETVTNVKLAPPITVNGTVVDENKQPFPSVSVTVKGTENRSITDAKGHFTLTNVDDKATLVFTFIGYKPKEVAVKANLGEIQMEVQNSELQEVNVAYGKTTLQANVSALTVIKGEQIQNLPSRSFDRSLQGLVPGLLVTPGTGQPGGGVSNFVLRGIATAANPESGSTVRNPLIVVDGVPVSQETTQMYISNATTSISNPLAHLNTSDIESITVLKDAAAIALYGANSGNGVIVVTTKKGKPGKTRFNFRQQTEFSDPTQKPDMLNQNEYIELLSETLGNSNPYYLNRQRVVDTLKKLFPVRADGSFYPATDWYNTLFKPRATTFTNELSISGGNEKTTFYLNLEYTKQDGIVRNTGFERKSFRLNLEHKPANWLKFGINTTGSHTLQDYGSSVAGGNDRRMENLMIWAVSPLIPAYLENGDLNLNFSNGVLATNKVNPLAAALYNTNRNTAYRSLTNLYSEVNLFKYLLFKTNLGFDLLLSEAKEKADPRLQDPGIGNIGGRVEERTTRRANLITTNILQYNQLFKDKHQVQILVGQEARILDQKVLGVAVTGLTSPYYDQITSPGATIFSQAGFVLRETLLSYFGQLNYNFNNKYFLTNTIRRDGSSRFGSDRRFGTYWSTGAGWIMSAEPFMSSTSGWLDHLKIRGSIGAAGNAGAIDRFTPYTSINPGQYSGLVSVRPNSSIAGNADVKWENTFSWDAGIEVRLLKERLSLTGDFYKRTTTDLIYSLPLPLTTGFRSILGNIGTMQNSGVELSLSSVLIKNRNFSWRLNANWSTNKNELVKANNNQVQTQLSVTFNQEGQSFNSFYLVKWAGVDPATGAALYIDSTGRPNANFAAAKPDFVGKSQPDGFGAITNTFSFRNLELSVMLYYQYGYNVYNNNVIRTTNDGLVPFANETKAALDRWQKPGDISPNPKRTLNNPAGGNNKSTRMLYDGDHIRLQNVMLSYQFPVDVIKRVKLTNLRLFIQGSNLAIWTKQRSSYADPASADAYGGVSYSYPVQRTWTFGLNAGF